MYWYKDNEKIDLRSDNRYVVSSEGLTINRVNYEDEGVYYCEAENLVDKVRSKQVRFKVTGKFMIIEIESIDYLTV